jgi:putative Holliday junction resolvase
MGRVAGIDFGTVRLGIAISDPSQTIASPWQTYRRGPPDQDAQFFRRLVVEQGIDLFVVGVPVYLDGRESPKSRQARRFGQWLEKVTGVPVVFYDERFSTRLAEEVLDQAGMTAKKRQSRLDMLAAQVMLSAYLEARRPGEGTTPLDDTDHADHSG